jgi:murein DD-endopeptidase MepM/ murein hydrolase activator NlpD
MSVSLVYFPVQVQQDFDFDQATDFHRSSGHRLCVKHITFSNDYDDIRPGGKHEAIDIFGAVGLWVPSTTDGTVVITWRYQNKVLPGSGYSHRGGDFVRIIDTNGNVHYYAHMRDPAFVCSGDMVFAGSLLGFLGKSGQCGCPHLHYQVRGPSPWNPGRGGRGINPYNELRRLYIAD